MSVIAPAVGAPAEAISCELHLGADPTVRSHMLNGSAIAAPPGFTGLALAGPSRRPVLLNNYPDA